MDKKAKILDIAMNLNRIGNWAADDFDGKKKRIKAFISLTSTSVNSLASSSFSDPFRATYEKFLAEYRTLEKAAQKRPKDELYWAEEMMTWGNILTHRSSLIK